MKQIILKGLILILLVSITLNSCNRSDESLDSVIEVQDFVWKGMNAYYLYQENISDLSDERFSSNQELESYLRGFDTPVDIFNSLKTSSDSRSILIDDYTISDAPRTLRSAFTPGMEFGLFKDPNKIDSIIGYVSHILPLSYAASKDITRGDFFYAIINQDLDTVRLVENNFRELLIDYQQDTLKLLMANFDGETLIINNKRVDLVKKSYQYPPIFLKKVIDLGVKKAGYLMYNNDFSNNYIGDLNTTILDFKNESVNELIIDLRYTIGSHSYARTIAEIATMITGQFPEEIVMKETWNLKAQPWFELNQPESLLTKFPTSLGNNEIINSLNLSDVYIILNGDSFTGSSATELLINSLRPYINVHVLGNKTRGDNLGSMSLYDSDDYEVYNANLNHFYSLKPPVLKFSNKEDETYDTGIIPTIQLCPTENPLNLGELGEVTDPLLKEVLIYVTTGNSGLNLPCNPFELEILYNSINSQRITDNGTFIKQDLPNLGR
tara:strand:- start:352 stop:1839 length:1488 start_codon:yes stop_codon:yes gene_type:complete